MPTLSPRPRHALSIATLVCLVFSQLVTFAPRSAAQTLPPVVISEFRTRGPAGGNDEFVELYNNGASPADVGGWRINGSNAAGTTSTRVTIAAGTVIPPRGHFLAVNSGAYSGAVPGDQTYGTGITDDGGVALLTPANAVVDQAGLSAGSAYKEGATLAPLTTNVNRSYERKPGGPNGSTRDTDDNAADFALLAPSDPQNLNSPPTPGGAISLSVGDASVNEGDAGTSAPLALTVSLSSPAGPGGVTFDVATQDGSATIADGDYAAQSLTAQIIPEGATTYAFAVTVNGDATPESDEEFAVVVSNVSGATVIDSAGAGRIVNDDFSLLAIHDVQGAGAESLRANTTVTTSGVVTGRRSNGFFIQTPDAEVDGDPNTSQGVFVFTSAAPPAAAAYGNLVAVTGTVVEFRPSTDPASPPLTEISNSPSVTLLSAGNALPAPATLTPAETDPNGAPEALERFEGMRVRVESLTVIAPTDGFVNEANATAASSGVFYVVVTGVARPFREPGIQLPNPLPTGAPANTPRFDSNPERLRVDSDAQPGAAALNVAAGQVIANVVGPLDYGFRAYTILPDPATITAPGPSVGAAPAAVPAPAPAANELTVASFNLERFFDTVNDPGIGEPVLTATAFNNRLNKASLIVRGVLRAPDVLGAIEVENLSTLQTLAAKINADAIAAGEPDPAYQAFLEEGNDVGGIDVGFLVKSSRVTVVDVTQQGANATFVNPINGAPEILNDRPPLILRASVPASNGAPYAFTVIVNHLRSLNDAEADTPDGGRIRAKRRAQAEYLANLIQARQTADSSERIVSVGDYNAFQFNDGFVDSIGTIKGQPTPGDQVLLASPDLVNPDLFNAAELLPTAERYSYVFDGNAQTLDHILVGDNLRGAISRFAYGRVNSDFPETLRNDANRPERLSDHDPAIVYLSLAENAVSGVTVERSGLSFSRTTRTFNGTVTLTNANAASVDGPLQIVFEDLPINVELVNRTGVRGAAPYIGVGVDSLAPGASITIPVRFSNPNLAAIDYTPVIYSGPFSPNSTRKESIHEEQADVPPGRRAVTVVVRGRRFVVPDRHR